MWRKLVYPILIAVLVFFLIRKWGELADLFSVLKTGSWILIICATLFQVLYYIFFSATYQSGMRAVGIPYRLREMTPVILSQQVVNVITGGAGMMGTALLIDDARRRGFTVLRATAGWLLALVLDYFGILIGLFLGFGYVFWKQNVSGYQILATAILLSLVILIATLFLLAAFQPKILRATLRTIAWGLEHIRRLIHRSSRSIHEWIEIITEEFQKATAVIQKNPRELYRLVFYALFSHLVNLTCLQMLFFAFGQTVPLSTLIAGYAAGKLFLVISITPQGLGVVEGVMTLIFTKLGVPGAVAAVVVLAFRGMNLWLPVLVGGFMLRKVRSLHQISLSEPATI